MDIKTVLCPLDFTELSRRELDLAVDVARRCSARLILEHNVDPQPPGGLAVSWMWRGAHVGQGANREAEAEARLREVMARLPPEVVCEARLTRGPVDETLTELARRLPAELLVMGSHGCSDTQHRSVTERVLRQSPCPVLTLAEEASSLFLAGRVVGEGSGAPAVALIAVTPTSAGRSTLAFGLDLCGSFNLKPLVLHVDVRASRRDYDRGRLTRDRQRLEALLPAEWQQRCECISAAGTAASGILDVAERHEARCLVLGCHDHFTFKSLAGRATAWSVLHGSRRPVWFLPASARHGAWTGAAA